MLIEISSHSTAEREKARLEFSFSREVRGQEPVQPQPDTQADLEDAKEDSLFCSVREVHHLESIKRQIFYAECFKHSAIDLRILFIEFSY